MKTKLPYIITALLLCFAGSTAFGQATQSHRVSFSGIDGFSGEVSFTSSRHSFGTTLKGKGAVLKLTDYNCTPEEKAALQKAGLDFWGYGGYVPKSFGVYIEGRAYVGMIVGDYFSYYAKSPGKLHLTANLGDEISFDFDQKAKDYEKNWKVGRPQNSSLWVEEGGFREETVTELYLSDLKTKIQQILYNYKKEKDRFAAFITQGTQEANQYHFEAAESALASAVALAENTSEMNNKISTLKKLIADKKSEKEKQDKKEAEEKEKQEAEQKEKEAKEKAEKEKQEATAKEKAAASGSAASSGGSDKKEEKSDDKEETGSDKKSSKTTYIPKSNRQLYNELKAMTDAHPEMLNDPKIRTRLRGYKAFADRDDRNIRDYNTLEQTMGGGYNPNKIAAMNSIYQTNSNIANAEMGVGAVVDEATNVVNSIIDEQNRKQDERNEEFRQQKSNALEKKQAIIEWERKIGEKRSDFEYEVAKKIKENFKLIATIPDMPVTYETEKYIEGGSYYKGNKSYYNAPSFEKITKELKDGGETKTYNIYIAELDGLYGILGDDGEALYPPQFEGIYALNLKNENKRPRFLVNIKDKWGELLADGSIAEAIKYDGIWYSPDKKSKILKQGDNWQIKSLEENRLLEQFSSDQIINLYAGGLIPISNTNQKQFNQFIGTYSLAGDGKVYVWGEAKEKGVVPILYDLAKKGEVTERLFKINNRWFITSGFGTKEMKIEPMPSTFVIPVIREKKWGAIDENGKTVIPFEHSYVRNSGNEFETDKGVYKTDGTLVTGGETKAALNNATKKYYDNGNLKSIGTYDANGNMTGTWKSYYETGQIHIEAEYLNGKYNGKWTSHFNNGKLSSIGNYKNGKKAGEWKFYNENGQVAMEGVFVDGNYNGEWKFYYKSGKLQKKGALTGSDANGKAQGEWYFYYENGNVESISTAKDNIPDGEWKSYYENGKLKETGTYKAGEKVGKWHQYDKNGNEI